MKITNSNHKTQSPGKAWYQKYKLEHANGKKKKKFNFDMDMFSNEDLEQDLMKMRMIEFVNRLKEILSPKQFDIYSRYIHRGETFQAIGKIYRMDAFETAEIFNNTKPLMKQIWKDVEELI